VTLPSAAYAYVDPGTGSMFLQFLLATVLGALYLLKSYWRKLRGWLMRGRQAAATEDPAPREPRAPSDNPAPTEWHD